MRMRCVFGVDVVGNNKEMMRRRLLCFGGERRSRDVGRACLTAVTAKTRASGRPLLATS
jgi:hypothetical protein